MIARPLEVLLHHLSAIAANGSEWERGFARSVLRQSRRRNWKPTAKREALMQRFVAELFIETDLEVIEE